MLTILSKSFDSWKHSSDYSVSSKPKRPAYERKKRKKVHVSDGVGVCKQPKYLCSRLWRKFYLVTVFPLLRNNLALLILFTLTNNLLYLLFLFISVLRQIVVVKWCIRNQQTIIGILTESRTQHSIAQNSWSYNSVGAWVSIDGPAPLSTVEAHVAVAVTASYFGEIEEASLIQLI